MKFFCDQCNAQYMIADEKVGPRGVKVKCKKCSHVITVKPAAAAASASDRTMVDLQVSPSAAPSPTPAAAPTPRRTETEISGAFDSLFAAESPAAKSASAFGGHAPNTPSTVGGEWYVAIEDSQIGPVGMAEIEQRWDARELTEESLAWKAGMTDWLAIGEIPELARLITDRPQNAKASAANMPLTPGSRAANAAAPVEWKPSAASALSSLVQEELLAAAQPKESAATKPPAGVPDLGSGYGTNDLFGGKVATSQPAESYPQSANWSIPEARKNENHMKPMYILVGVVCVVVVSAVGFMAWFMTRQNAAIAVQHAPAAAPVAAPPPQQVAVAAPAPAPAPTPTPAPAAATTAAPAATAKTEEDGEEGRRKHMKAKHRAGMAREEAPTAAPVPSGPVKASLTKDDIWNVVKANAAKTMPCLRAARTRGEILPSKYTFIIDWTIRPDGGVSDAHLKGPPQVLATSLPQCFSGVLEQWHFPASQSGAPIKNFPFGPVNVPP